MRERVRDGTLKKFLGRISEQSLGSETGVERG